MPVILILLLTGLHFREAPPADFQEAVALLRETLTEASPSDLGMFFAAIGLAASPDEVHLWADEDFYDLAVDFSPKCADGQPADSLMPLVMGLPLDILVQSEPDEKEHCP